MTGDRWRKSVSVFLSCFGLGLGGLGVGGLLFLVGGFFVTGTRWLTVFLTIPTRHGCHLAPGLRKPTSTLSVNPMFTLLSIPLCLFATNPWITEIILFAVFHITNPAKLFLFTSNGSCCWHTWSAYRWRCQQQSGWARKLSVIRDAQWCFGDVSWCFGSRDKISIRCEFLDIPFWILHIPLPLFYFDVNIIRYVFQFQGIAFQSFVKCCTWCNTLIIGWLKFFWVDAGNSYSWFHPTVFSFLVNHWGFTSWGFNARCISFCSRNTLPLFFRRGRCLRFRIGIGWGRLHFCGAHFWLLKLYKENPIIQNDKKSRKWPKKVTPKNFKYGPKLRKIPES